jgi:1,4-alpha-glucan branching enzyme
VAAGKLEQSCVAGQRTAAADTGTRIDTDTKLARYYGVNQIDGAVVFMTLSPRAQIVQVAGDFNGWQPARTAMKKVAHNGVWQAKVKLPPGTYRYRLVVDGRWQQDPYNDLSEPNIFGDLNSVIEVK